LRLYSPTQKIKIRKINNIQTDTANQNTASKTLQNDLLTTLFNIINRKNIQSQQPVNGSKRMCSQIKTTLTSPQSPKIKISNHKYLKIIINFKMTIIPCYFPLINSHS
jgi:hypothetical protein